MCGILVSLQKKKPLDEQQKKKLSRALSEISFRGPDLQIEKVLFNHIYFGQTILSLTGDVSKSHGEHLSSENQKYQIAFNGEIYNYRDLLNQHLSHTKLSHKKDELTDTEVLVNLHERLSIQDVSKILDGMYAYALFDLEKQKLFLNRDPQGEKTLYIFEDQSHLIISSEIRAIARLVPLEIDDQVLKDYFGTRHFMFEGRTLYKGVRQLLPGQAEELDFKSLQWKKHERLELSSFIDSQKYRSYEHRNLDDLVDELDEILKKNIQQMIPINRNLATVVSGGIDSSLISYYAKEKGNPALFLAVNHHKKDLISQDLQGFEKILDHKVHIIEVDQVVYSQSLGYCQKVISAPIFSHSFVGQSLQSQFARGEGCTAMFGGEGADELFGGYEAYNHLPHRTLETQFSRSPYSTFQKSNVFLKNDSEKIEQELSALWKNSLSHFSHIQNPQEKAAHAMMYCDLSYQLPAVGLRGADQMSMMWSLETRSVFLRRDIIQFALNLPMKYKADPNEPDKKYSTKKVLKKLFARKYGEALIIPKQGFSGFPNESGIYLGRVENFRILDFLGYQEPREDLPKMSRDFLWKLINLEYYLRAHFNEDFL